MLIPKQFFFLIFETVSSLSEIFIPPKSEESPLMVKIVKNCPKAVFDTQKKRPDALNATQKPQLLTKYGFWKNQE